jgi:hypothetical protein
MNLPEHPVVRDNACDITASPVPSPALSGAQPPVALRRQRGASLLEVIAYLGVAAIIILGAIALLSSAFSGANTNRTATEVSTIRTGVKKLYMGQQASFSGITTTVLIAAKVFPSSLNISGTTAVYNPWGGAVTVTASADNMSFILSYAKVPQDVCINTVSSSGDWNTVAVGTTSMTPPISPATATTACSGTTNTITWTGA